MDSPDPLGDVAAALDHFRAKLAHYDKTITSTASTRHLGIREARQGLRVERQHLAVLLRMGGVDVPELEEGK